MNLITAAIAVCLLAVSSTQPEARRVRLASSIGPDKTLSYTIDQRLQIESVPEIVADDPGGGGDGGGEAEAAPGEGRLAEQRHAADIRLVPRRLERDGSGEFLLSFDRVEIAADTSLGRLEFAWTRADGAAPPAADAESDAHRAGMVLATTIPIVTIDPAGAVTSIDGLDAFIDEASVFGEDTPIFVGLFTPERMAEAVETILCADGSARVAVRSIGDTWRTVRAVTMPPVGRVETTTEWSLPDAAADTATLKGSSVARLELLGRPDSSRPSAEIIESEGTTTVKWDTTGDALIERTTTRSLVSRWTLGRQSLVQRQTAVVEIKRRPTEPTPDAP